MTPEQQNKLEAIKAALKQHIEEAEKATPGPWKYSWDEDDPICEVIQYPSQETDVAYRRIAYSHAENDAEFIGCTRTMSPLACKMALIGIQCLEDIYNGNGNYLIHAHCGLRAITNTQEGGQP